jgi:hypothetical protein
MAKPPEALTKSAGARPLGARIRPQDAFSLLGMPGCMAESRNPASRRTWPGCGEPGTMRSDVPPPGRAMTFPEWARAIVDGVRAFLPDATAVRKGHRQVIIRHGDLEAHLVDDVGAFCIRFRAGDSATTMSGLVDRDRRDAHTTSTLAHSVAGFFDARFTRARMIGPPLLRLWLIMSAYRTPRTPPAPG